MEVMDDSSVGRLSCDGKGPLERVFGTAAAKIIDFLIVQKGMDHSEQEIADMAGLSSKTVSREMPQIVEDGIAEVHRTVGGRIRMYWLNPKSKVAGGFESLAFELAQKRIEVEGDKIVKSKLCEQSKLDMKVG